MAMHKTTILEFFKQYLLENKRSLEQKLGNMEAQNK